VDIRAATVGFQLVASTANGFVTLVGLAGGDLWPLAFHDAKISYSGYRFPASSRPFGFMPVSP
jgi:hypothetical protein